MSEATKAALEAAIDAHVGESWGKYPSGYVLIIETTDLGDFDSPGTFRLEMRSGQSPFLTGGLISAALNADRIDSREENQ